MLELDTLRIADVHAWLGCQKRAALLLGCNQSTVSRRIREARWLASLGSSHDGRSILEMERSVHQCWRFRNGRDLRLHAYPWMQPLLRPHLPESWMANPADAAITPTCPLQLLQDHVVDAVLAPWPLVADLDEERFARLTLYFAPLLLLLPVRSALSHERRLNNLDIARDSRPGTLAFLPPAAIACGRHLDAQLFGAAGPRCADTDAPAPLAESKTPRYWGTPLTSLVRPDLVPADYPSPLNYVEVLVCLRTWQGHPQIGRLLAVVRQALGGLSGDRSERERIAVA